MRKKLWMCAAAAVVTMLSATLDAPAARAAAHHFKFCTPEQDLAAQEDANTSCGGTGYVTDCQQTPTGYTYWYHC